MKARTFLMIIIITFLFSGCVVYSFYPLYTEKDLFPNDILTGEWYQSDDQELDRNDVEATWKFVHPNMGKKDNEVLDSTSYFLVVSDKDSLISKFNVHVIELGGYYFLDFYLDEFPPDDNIDLAAFHIIPVHTFAKLTVKEDKMIINWFDQDWLSELIRENKIRIHHEESDDFVLLTAKPKELQKFVTKYVNSEEAFDEGLEVVLHRK
jgi:hypothetical protein